VTPQDIVVAAQGIAADFTDEYPTAKSVMYRRISARQRELFVHIGTLDTEVYGEDVVAEVLNGAVDLGALEQSEDVFPVETLQMVRIHDPGTNGQLKAKQRVSVVPADDVEAFLPPRCTYRSGVLRQVGSDLAGVAQLLVSYSRRPRTIGVDGSGQIELLEPFQDLLVFDLARDLIRRTVALEGERKAAVLAMLEPQETQLLASLEEHIRHSASLRDRRFYPTT
jgi:hypothetical protein